MVKSRFEVEIEITTDPTSRATLLSPSRRRIRARPKRRRTMDTTVGIIRYERMWRK